MGAGCELCAISKNTSLYCIVKACNLHWNVGNLWHPCLGDCGFCIQGTLQLTKARRVSVCVGRHENAMTIAKGGAATQLHHVVPHHAAMGTRELPTCGNHQEWDCCIGLCSIGGQEDDCGPRGRGTGPGPGLAVPRVSQHLHRCTVSPPLYSMWRTDQLLEPHVRR